MRGWFRSLAVLAVMAELWTGLSAFSPTPTEIKLALQEGGTASWEAAAMRELKLDEKNGVKLEIRNVADSQASQVALQAGEVEVILSDFVWTSLQRDQGGDLTFVPHSLAVGGLLAMPGGKVKSVADLKGATLASAGGPVDKRPDQRHQDQFWSPASGQRTIVPTSGGCHPELLALQCAGLGGRSKSDHLGCRAACTAG
jgi:ABC-type nitrate/sulfonate/bicarbonate transport system substrate-binding protein